MRPRDGRARRARGRPRDDGAPIAAGHGRQGRWGSFIRDMALSRADLAWMLVTCLLLSRLLAIHRAQQIQLKTSPAEQQGMRRAGAQAASLLTYLDAHVIPGVSSAELDELAHHYTTHELGARPAPLHYGGLIGGPLYDLGIPPPAALTTACGWAHSVMHAVGFRGLPLCGFPATICISVNNCVCHGVPSSQRLQLGDIVNIDVTVITPEGWHGDTSRMWLVGGPGAVTTDAAALVADTRQAMWHGIRQCHPGNHVGDIGFAIQDFAEQNGYGVVRDFVGHGIGQHFHESPMVPHFGEPGAGPLLEVGMIITIEPMLNQVCRPAFSPGPGHVSTHQSTPHAAAMSAALNQAHTIVCTGWQRGSCRA